MEKKEWSMVYYCKRCKIAGDIDHEYMGQIGCINCGQDLDKKSCEWIESKGISMVKKEDSYSWT